jgi:hypothetical protein
MSNSTQIAVVKEGVGGHLPTWEILEIPETYPDNCERLRFYCVFHEKA